METTKPTPIHAVALCTDLIFGSKLRETARTAAVNVIMVRDGDALVDAVDRALSEPPTADASHGTSLGRPLLVFVDLSGLTARPMGGIGGSASPAAEPSPGGGPPPMSAEPGTLALTAIRQLQRSLREREASAHSTTRSNSRSVELIGFASHVQVELKKAALEAGCHRVLARSQFTLQLPALLSPHQNAPKSP